MSSRLGKSLWGLALIVIGIGFAGNAFGIWDFDLFFSGWWTLFIIVPCIISMTQNGITVGNAIGVVIGCIFLLSAQNIINGDIIRKLVFPIILVGIGIIIIFGGRWGKNKSISKHIGKDGMLAYTAIFGGQDCQFAGERFDGADLTAIFGGITLNLRESVINQDVQIDVVTIFGGADIFVPGNVKVKVKSTPIFGGVSNKAVSSTDEDAPIIFISSTCIFGGVDVK